MIQGHFLSNVLLKALPAGLTDVLIVGFLTIFGKVFGLTNEEISTAATLLLAIVGLMILFNISKPMNKFRWVIWFGMVAGLLFCSIFLKDLFAIGKITTKCGLVLIIFAIATEPLLRYISILIRNISNWKKRRNEKKMEKKLKKSRSQKHMIPLK